MGRKNKRKSNGSKNNRFSNGSNGSSSKSPIRNGHQQRHKFAPPNIRRSTFGSIKSNVSHGRETNHDKNKIGYRFDAQRNEPTSAHSVAIATKLDADSARDNSPYTDSNDHISSHSLTGEDVNTDFTSRKRSLTPITFVYPVDVVAGRAQSITPTKVYKFTGIHDATVEHDDTVTDTGDTKPHRSHETLDDILGTNKKRTLLTSPYSTSTTVTSKSEYETDNDSVSLWSSATSQHETPDRQTPRRLDYSMAEAVQDKSGCRPRANSTDGELMLPQRGLCDERQVLQTYRWKRIEQLHSSRPKGLSNLGNTCFLNSTLQCLAYLAPFCQSIMSISAVQTKQSKNGSKNANNSRHEKKITNLLRDFFHQVHGTNDRGAVAPRQVVNALPTLGTHAGTRGYKFRLGRQEDAHEFLVHLLDAMHHGELVQAGIQPQQSGWRDRLPIARLDETTLIHRIFGGYFRSQVRCTKCDYRSNTYDPFLDMNLEVSQKSCRSILDSLKEFSRKEQLDSDNRWKCSRCKKHVRATKQITVFRPPLVLCIQLKRFAFSGFGGGGGGGYGGFGGGRGGKKISKAIDFPCNLVLPLSDDRSCEYTLSGVVVHVGSSANSGHYTAFVCKPGSSKRETQWLHMDDSSVQPVSEKTVMRQRDAYLLFYTRKEVKIEYPQPPHRSTMSTAEAQEFGRARARARSESLTETIQSLSEHKDRDDVTMLSPMHPSKLNGEIMDEEDKDVSIATTLSDCSQKAAAASSASMQHSSSSNIPANDAGTISSTLHNSSATTSASSSSSQSSTTSSSTSSSASSASTKASHLDKNTSVDIQTSTGNNDDIIASKNGKNDAVVQSSNKGKVAASSTNNDNDGDLESVSSQDGSKGASDDIKRDSNNGDLKSVSSQDSSSSASDDIKQDSKTPLVTAVALSTQPRKDTVEVVSLQKVQKKKAKQTIVHDRGPGREKIEVTVVPRFKNSMPWKPDKVVGAKDEQFGLLGNVQVDKWDDDDEVDNNDDKKHDSSRASIVQSIEKEAAQRKRAMHLDRWDSALDQGKTKKVKSNDKNSNALEVNKSPGNNRFQRIQSSIARMNKGKPKGYKNTPPARNNKKQQSGRVRNKG